MFYKETNFRETPIGRIPKDWAITKLESICEKVRAGGTPLTSKKEYWNGDLPFVKIEDITLAGKYLTETQSFISEEGLNNSSAWLVPENSLLFAMYGSMGEVAINKIPVTTNQAILGIIPKERDDIEFLYYWFSFFKPRWKKYAKPTTQANLTAEILRNSLIPLPSYNERKAIAEVLSVVDSAIELVDKIIWKTERLKKALMQTLLTRGIGHKEFKETEIGKIPKTWQIMDASKITVFIKDGTHTPPKRVENGIPLLSAQNIVDGKIVRTDEDTYITEDDYWKIHSKYEIQKNDVLLTIVGTIGNSAVVDVDYKFTLQRSVAIFRPKLEIVEPRFLNYVFQSNQFQRQLYGHSKLTTQGGVYLKELSKLKIPVPPLSEQRRISDILFCIDKKLELEKKGKARLEKIKRSLMDLLLTGKIRVKVD
ncbi:MAG: restriction endonuclease subunit S [Nitrososphaeria archaeon]